MWPFKSIESLRESGIFSGFTDWHSHILPGVDDGISNMDDSLEVLRTYEDMGFKRIWLTPHIMEDYPNSPSDLKKRYDSLCRAWTGSLELKLASENMLDSLFEQRLEEDDLLPIGDDGRHLLVETSYYTPPMEFDNILERIKNKGYYPVLAHPERYRYMEEDDYRRLRNKGIIFQLNFVSIVGGYGETAQKKASWLLKNNMIDILGSDVHRLSSTIAMIDSKPRKQRDLDMLKEICARMSREAVF